jgi:hypothetical protein
MKYNYLLKRLSERAEQIILSSCYNCMQLKLAIQAVYRLLKVAQYSSCFPSDVLQHVNEVHQLLKLINTDYALQFVIAV